MKRAMSGMETKKPRTRYGASSQPGSLLLRCRLDGDDRLALRTLLRVLHVARGSREQRVVLADAHVHAGMEARAALANEDRSRVDELAAEGLQAQALALGVAAVAGRAACFLVCHLGSLDDRIHTDFRVVLAMPLGLLVMLAAAHLEDADLLAAPVGDDGGGDCRSGHQGITDLQGVAIRDHEHLVEDNLSANVCRYLFYFDFLAGGNSVLLAAGF